MSNVNILLVDDHAENLIALEAILEGVGNLVKATSGREALRELLRTEFAVILLDVQMPEMDGFETATLIRERAKLQSTPIIFLTARDKSDQNVFKGYSIGAVDYLLKPFSAEVLKAKVLVFIELFKKTEEIKRQADLLREVNGELERNNKAIGALYSQLELQNIELNKERDFVSAVIETAGSFVVVLDSDGRIERFNRASQQTSGYSLDEVHGAFAWDVLIAEEDRELVHRTITTVRETRVRAIPEPAHAILARGGRGTQLHPELSALASEVPELRDVPANLPLEPIRGEWRWTTRSCGVRNISWYFTALTDREGEARYIIGTGIDITDRVSAEEALRTLNDQLEHRVMTRTAELQQANHELESEVVERKRAESELSAAKDAAERANRAKDQFLAVLSHELRTPLTPVLAIVQMLMEEEGITDEVKNWLCSIRRNVELEARLIDDLLDLTRIAKGKLQLSPTSVQVHELVDAVIEICKADIDQKKLTVVKKLEATDDHIHGDAARIQQVLWNILKNAVKFTPSGGEIIVESRTLESGAFRLSVTDTGIGISPEVLPIVFDAFEQGSNSITHEFGGLGLGLAISKALVEAHRGAISVASEGKNRGATFTLDLPVDEAMTLAPETKKANAERNTLALRLLVIEDNEDTGLAMRLLLQRHGYRVEVVRTLHDALTCYKQLTFDAVISDIGLPDGTGLDLIQKINQIRPVPAVALSGFGMESDIQKSLEAGFKAHLTKPVDFAQLHDTLQRITEPQPAPVE